MDNFLILIHFHQVKILNLIDYFDNVHWYEKNVQDDKVHDNDDYNELYIYKDLQHITIHIYYTKLTKDRLKDLKRINKFLENFIEKNLPDL